jgi:penicillin amidase
MIMFEPPRTSRYLPRLSCLLLPLALASGAAMAKPGGGGEVKIIRDNYGTPHVFGSTAASTWYGVGYAMAQDRLWQAELLRRTARGTTAELFGPGKKGEILAGDITLRALTGTEAGRIAQLEAASEEVKAIFTAYTAGINAWIAEASSAGELPVEFSVFDITPEAWQPTDTVNILQILWLDVATGGGVEELANADQLQELIDINGAEAGAMIFADTHWLDDPDAPAIVPAEGAVNPPRRGAGIKSGKAAQVVADTSKIQGRLDGMRANLRRVGMGGGSASNAVAIGPELSASGRPLLLGGPQLPYTTPQFGHEMGIHYGAYDLFGVTAAAVPLTIVGVSGDMAWTTVTGGTDNQDIYVEKVNPENPQQYWFNGEWLDYDCRVETFGVAGESDVNQTICESVHGPVIGAAGDLRFSLKVAGRGKDVETYEAYLELNRSRSVQEAQDALERFAFNLSLVSADRRGNIAYWHLGKIPIRAEGDNPWLPHDGTGGAEWQGYIPWEDMPRTVNPDQGWITAWNNKPRAGWQNSRNDFYDWGPVHRVDVLNSLLAEVEPGTASLDTLEEINITTGWTIITPQPEQEEQQEEQLAWRNVFAPTMLPILLAHVDTSADPRLPAMIALLNGWNQQLLDEAPQDGRYDSPAVATFNTWWNTLLEEVFRDELGTVQDALFNAMANLVYRLLVEDAALPLAYDYLNGETAEEAVTGALVSALDTLESQYGSAAPADWLQPIFEIVWTPLPGAGSVDNTIWMNRGTYNYLIQHGPGQNFIGQSVLAPGQSGDRASPHFSDQLDLYANWRYKPMRLKRSDLNGVIDSVSKLKPDFSN